MQDLSPAHSVVLYASEESGRVNIVKIATTEPPAIHHAHDDAILCIHPLHGQHPMLITSAMSGQIRVWNTTPSLSCVKEFKSPDQWTSCIASLPDDRIVILTSNGLYELNLEVRDGYCSVVSVFMPIGRQAGTHLSRLYRHS